ncbi:J domain-containing protein [Phaeovibrio sulfidiphilus]|uniref:J domain-containing protein n=1 Tax=Phaeovibrio sulfidiphilus TaxID=1220600 RepID=A0A8J6YZB3_9PROT|nr:J domain-containing protein [Phaeovibrio sulfidiphilus]MBE1237283.1 J domain-containing protein [Phaeovibrio sulfidiphilus]
MTHHSRKSDDRATPRSRTAKPKTAESGRKRVIPDLDDLLRTESRQPQRRACDHPGCEEEGLHRAPRDRTLKSYYWFCLNHVQAYNKAWNYYAGLDEAAMEDEIRRSTVWDRPTWPLGENGPNSPRGPAKGDPRDPFGFYDREMAPKGARAGERRGRALSEGRVDGPRARAMRVFGLDEPLTHDALRRRYKELVKRYHPDVNGGARDAEERFKMVGDAYRVLMRSLKDR